MNERAQSGLEYLMTYGWALILIATVIGVLVFIVSSPAEEFRCSISDPTKIMLKAYNVPESAYRPLPSGDDHWCSGSSCGAPTGTNKILMQNLTGGAITITSVRCVDSADQEVDCCAESSKYIESCNLYAPIMAIADRCLFSGSCALALEESPLVLGAGQEFSIYDFYVHYSPGDAQYTPPGKIKFYYTDVSGLSRSATITCSGIPPKP